jgi:hypothetical protein
MMLIKAIDKYLKSRPQDKRRIRCFHPSSLHKSAESLYRAYFEGDSCNEFKPRFLRIFDNGHSVHERLQRYLKEIGVLVEPEVPVENEKYEIAGTCDGIVQLGSKKGVLEIKSINTSGFYSMHEPKPEHLIQINVYMFCLDIPRGCLVYENKDNQRLKEFYVRLDQSILDPVLEKIRLVQSWIRGGVIGETK